MSPVMSIQLWIRFLDSDVNLLTEKPDVKTSRKKLRGVFTASFTVNELTNVLKIFRLWIHAPVSIGTVTQARSLFISDLRHPDTEKLDRRLED